MPILFQFGGSPPPSRARTFRHLYSSALDYELGTDDSTTLFTTARRKQCINEGVEQFADLTECYIRQSTIVSSHGVREYSLESTVNIPAEDYVRIARQRPEFHLVSSHGGSSAQITVISGPNFERRDIDWLNQYEQGWRTSTGGTPRYWYERVDGGNRYFGLTPPPQIGSSETGKVLLNYVASPQEMTSDTAVPYAVADGQSTGTRTDLGVYQQAIVHYAAHKLEKLRINTEGSQTQMQIFLGWVERYINDRRPKGGQTIRTGRNYFGEMRNRRGGGAELPTPMSGWNY
jgi:hypothetical protein